MSWALRSCSILLSLTIALGNEVDEKIVKDFKSATCLTGDLFPQTDFKTGFFSKLPLVLELNSWDSHRLVTLVAALLLQEALGYEVLINPVDYGKFTYHRIRAAADSQQWSWLPQDQHGSTVRELLGQGRRNFAYANVETWSAGKDAAWLNGSGYVDVGALGYEGQDGWYVFFSKINVTT